MLNLEQVPFNIIEERMQEPRTPAKRESEGAGAPVSLLCLLPGNNILHRAASGSHA